MLLRVGDDNSRWLPKFQFSKTLRRGTHRSEYYRMWVDNEDEAYVLA